MCDHRKPLSEKETQMHVVVGVLVTFVFNSDKILSMFLWHLGFNKIGYPIIMILLLFQILLLNKKILTTYKASLAFKVIGLKDYNHNPSRRNCQKQLNLQRFSLQHVRSLIQGKPTEFEQILQKFAKLSSRDSSDSKLSSLHPFNNIAILLSLKQGQNQKGRL